MFGEIQALFNKYQQKYPLYSSESIADIMLKDGVITPDVAGKIRAGGSLFSIDERTKPCQTEDDFDITRIMGGEFPGKSAKTSNYKPKLNREIEPAYQGNQGDCWLLSDINSLNQTEWGKKVIKDAIIPDLDGSGGVTVRFKGSPIDEKEFYISPMEIEDAKISGHYSNGDDDMIALELATEKVIRKLVETGQGKRVSDFDDVLGYESYLTGVVLDDVMKKYLSVSTLLTGVERSVINFALCDSDGETRLPGLDNTLKHLTDNWKKHSAVCTFNHLKDGMRSEDDPVHGNHAYAIKKITYGKEVVVTDPYCPDEEIKLSWEKFIDDVETVFVASENQAESERFNASKPANYDALNEKHMKDLHEERQQIFQYIQELYLEVKERKRQDKLKQILDDSSWDLLEQENDFAYNGIKSMLNKVDKDIVLDVLDAKPELISKLDKYRSGIGRGNEKKELIAPIITALSEKARECGVDEDAINGFLSACNRELNALFYTNERVIIEEIDKIKSLIEK